MFSDYLDVLRHLFFRKLIKFIYADASTNLILKDFVMSSAPNRPFPCAIENTKENMVLAFSRANNFNLKAKSLRKKTNNEVYASSHLILAIFSQEEIDKYQEIIESTAHLIMQFSQEGGFDNASGF